MDRDNYTIRQGSSQRLKEAIGSGQFAQSTILADDSHLALQNNVFYKLERHFVR